MGVLKKSATVERVVESAAKLFLQQGFHEVSMDRVAEQAGVTKVTVYQYFSSKEELLGRCLRWRLERREAALDHVLAADLTPVDALLAIFSWMEANAEKTGFPGCAFLRASGEVSKRSAIHEIARAAKERLRKRCTALATAAGCQNSGVMGMTLALLIEGAQALSLVEQSAEPFRVARFSASALLKQDTQ